MPVASAPPLRAAAQGLSLSLAVAHSVLVGLDAVDARLPGSVDILSNSDIAFSISGFFNRVNIPADKLQKSALVHHLLSYLKTARKGLFFCRLALNTRTALRRTWFESSIPGLYRRRQYLEM
jgi:hypothetical protein